MSTLVVPKLAWSPQQEAIFAFVQNGAGSATVVAVAGSGKTSTIVEAAHRLPMETDSLFIAFNRRIADELKKRLPSSVSAMTLNALGSRAWAKFTGRTLAPDAYKLSNIIRDRTPNRNKDFMSATKKLVSMAQNAGIVPETRQVGEDAKGLVGDYDTNWLGLMDRYEIEWVDSKELIRFAREVLSISIRLALVEDAAQAKFDFNDQIYMPLIFNAPFRKYDLVFVDEAQDINEMQKAIIRRSLAPDGRLIAVGDPRQAIYGFRGAGTNSIAELQQEFAAIELPLTVSYRCPRKVVERARMYVSHIEPAPNAPDGSVTQLGVNWDDSTFRPGDVILCRNNAPLIARAFALIRARVSNKVIGRDIGAGILALLTRIQKRVEKSNWAESASVQAIKDELSVWSSNEIGKLYAQRKPDEADRLSDRVQTLRVFLNEEPRTLAELRRDIEGMFQDGEGSAQDKVILSTVHKAKGGEWDRVFILNQNLFFPSWAMKLDTQREQETNLVYVATTRARRELYYIDE